jgi:hypothetical protein
MCIYDLVFNKEYLSKVRGLKKELKKYLVQVLPLLRRITRFNLLDKWASV